MMHPPDRIALTVTAASAPLDAFESTQSQFKRVMGRRPHVAPADRSFGPCRSIQRPSGTGR
jgi:hypothetical protein